jgi:uncharacterized pyridoxal phosphate-dependent enzyme
MPLSAIWNRRSFLGGISTALAAVASPRTTLARTRSSVGSVTSGLGATGSVYDELGVTPVINAQATMTFLGGSLIPAEVEAVMRQAAEHFVNINELEVAAGNHIAKLLKLPDDYTVLVTGGAAAALQCGLAGIMTGENETFIRQLPDVTGVKSEVIIQKSHRYAFDHQLRNTGAKLIEIESRDDLRKAINDRTAMMHFANWLNPDGQIKVDEWAKLAHEHHLPCFNDAAADTPPVTRLTEYANMGYDLITFSGGKAMRGPQCAGLLIGRKPLIRYAALNMSPNEDVIGRSSKIGKEEIVGMTKAVELFLAQDHEGLHQEWTRRLQVISKAVTCLPGVQTSFFEPEIANHFPTMRVTWDPKHINASSEAVALKLKTGKPSIVIASEHGELQVTSFLLKPGEEKIVAAQLAAALKSGQQS